MHAPLAAHSSRHLPSRGSTSTTPSSISCVRSGNTTRTCRGTQAAAAMAASPRTRWASKTRSGRLAAVGSVSSCKRRTRGYRRAEDGIKRRSFRTSTATVPGRQASSGDMLQEFVETGVRGKAHLSLGARRRRDCAARKSGGHWLGRPRSGRKNRDAMTDPGLPAQTLFASFIPMRYSPERDRMKDISYVCYTSY